MNVLSQLSIWIIGLSLAGSFVVVVILSAIPNALKNPSLWGWVGIFIAFISLILLTTCFLSKEISKA